ncbi:MAG TPA: AAC(3) family N-acetyltransferase [Myxococcota bacterium]
MSQPLTIAALTEQLQALGVRAGGVLVVHSSFRAVRGPGLVEGGPAGVIAALRAALGPAGTLVMPTMTDGASRFDPTTTPGVDMGIIAETFWRGGGDVVRSTHPGGSFAAAGPDAAAICRPQPLSPPHGVDSPVGRVWQLQGQVLLLGVGHSENTTLHLAEDVAGVPYAVTHPCVVTTEIDGVLVDTVVEIAETDHCCTGFDKVEPLLRARGQQRDGVVGQAAAKLIDAVDVVDVAVAKLRREPLWFLCNTDAGCDECDAARASVAVGSG